MATLYAEFLALKAIREELGRGGETAIWRRTDPAIRQAVEREYFRVLGEVLLRTKYNDQYNTQQQRGGPSATERNETNKG